MYDKATFPGDFWISFTILLLHYLQNTFFFVACPHLKLSLIKQGI